MKQKIMQRSWVFINFTTNLEKVDEEYRVTV